jgi:hypothetical protein
MFVHGWLALRAIAGLLLLCGTTIIAMGAIPGVPFLLAFPVLLLGVGLTAGDGVVVAAGLLATTAAAAAVSWMI